MDYLRLAFNPGEIPGAHSGLVHVNSFIYILFTISWRASGSVIKLYFVYIKLLNTSLYSVSYEKFISIHFLSNGMRNSSRNQPFFLHCCIRSWLRKGSSTISAGSIKSGLKKIICACLGFSKNISTWHCIFSGKVSSWIYLRILSFLSSVISSRVSS